MNIAGLLRSLPPALALRASNLPWQLGPGTCKQPVVFLLGGPRSGTTLLKQILGAFPEICTIEAESTSLFLLRTRNWHKQWIGDALGASTGDLVFKGSASSTIAFDRLASALLKQTRATYFLDKLNTVALHNPKFYVRRFPQGRFIFIVRDPRDAVASAGTHIHLKTQSVSKMARTWNAFVNFAEDLQQLCPVHCLRYEDLTRNPEETVSMICQQLEIPFSPDRLNPDTYAPKKNMTRTEGFWRLQEPISPKSVGRYAERLSEDDIARIEKICAHGMTRWGY